MEGPTVKTHTMPAWSEKRSRSWAGDVSGRPTKRRYQRLRWAPRRMAPVGAGVNQQTHRFKRQFLALAVTGNAAFTPAYLNAFSVNLGLLPGVSDFANLYDEYRIDFVKHKVFLSTPPEAAPLSSSNSFPIAYWAIDKDDDTPPASLDEIRQHGNVQTAMLTNERPIIITYKPSCLVQAYRTAVSTGYSAKQGQWIDMAGTNVPHYGLKFGLNDFTNTAFKVIIETTLWVSMRNAR